MAVPRKSRGFTLVELLVVITIIGMLVSLLLPAVQSAREAGRRNTCINNQRNCALAMVQLEQTRKGFPGYVNNLHGKRASWAVMILPNLERSDLYNIWKSQPAVAIPSGAVTTNGTRFFDASNADIGVMNPWPFSEVTLFNCPSKPISDTTGNPMSWVVNTGWIKSNADNFPTSGGPTNPVADDVNSGVCFNQFGADSDKNQFGKYAPTPPSGGRFSKVAVDFLNTNDGSSYTLLMSENIQSSDWATDPTILPSGGTSPLQPWSSDFQVRQQLGFAWYYTTASDNRDLNGGRGINSQLNNVDAATALPAAFPPLRADSTQNDGLGFSRPSSQHPGGAVAFFCDGHQAFLTDELPYHVYTQLMTSNQRGTVAYKTAAANTWVYTLSEADF